MTPLFVSVIHQKRNSMEQEVWKDIPGYEGIYQVSTLGFVRSLDCKCEGKCIKGKMVTRHINSHNGYYYVRLGDKTKSVHRLVALTFIPNPENKPCVGHKDTNRQNPRVENLEWEHIPRTTTILLR